MGGALYNYGSATMTGSTFAFNSSSNFGGGALYNDAGGTLTLINSTVSSNSTYGDGGGIYNNAGGTLNLYASTTTNNSVGIGAGGGIANAGSAILVNSIVAGNGAGGDCSGGLTAASTNLDSDGSCGNAATTATPLLGPLQLNLPGSTATHALLPGSPAIDGGDNAACAAGPISAIDQRGVIRPWDGQCDIGAYEVYLIDFDGLAAETGTTARDLLNTTYSPDGATFDFATLTGGYPATGGDAVTVVTDPGGADAVINFDFAVESVTVMFLTSDSLGVTASAYSAPITPAAQPAVTVDDATDSVDPYPKSVTVSGQCIRSLSLDTDGVDFQFDNVELVPMLGPDGDGDGVVDVCDTPFVVTSADDVDDGACNVAHCSLREAINAANAKLNGLTPDEIHFAISFSL
jgi:CSLREA domain-containing protein